MRITPTIYQSEIIIWRDASKAIAKIKKWPDGEIHIHLLIHSIKIEEMKELIIVSENHFILDTAMKKRPSIVSISLRHEHHKMISEYCEKHGMTQKFLLGRMIQYFVSLNPEEKSDFLLLMTSTINRNN